VDKVWTKIYVQFYFRGITLRQLACLATTTEFTFFLTLLVTSRNSLQVCYWYITYTCIIFEILLQNRPSLSTFLITSCGNEGGDDLRRDTMTKNQILSSRINENVCKHRENWDADHRINKYTILQQTHLQNRTHHISSGST